MKRLTSIAAAVFTAAFLSAAATASAQDSNVDQRTYLTFSGPVQMPGVTLPAGKYTFKLADTALHNIMQVYDSNEQHIIGQWFFVPRNRTTEEMDKANGKPVVTFREMPEGVTPAVQYFFYPTDLTGKEFIYPKDQAVKIAAASHSTVLATDTDVTKGGEAHVFRVNPDGTEAAYDSDASASSNNTADNSSNNANAASDSSKAASASDNASAPSTASTASLNSSADLNNSPALGPPASARPTDQSSSNNRPAATSGTSNQNQAATDQSPAPRQQAAAQLPKTASPLQLIGLVGLLSLAGGFGLRVARATN